MYSICLDVFGVYLDLLRVFDSWITLLIAFSSTLPTH